MKSSKKKSQFEILDYYDSIDYLPILNWSKVHETSDLSYLLRTKIKLNDNQIEELEKVWQMIYEEYIRAFGYGEAFLNIIDQKLKISRLKNKQVITGDDSIENIIRINERILESSQKLNKGGDIYKIKQSIEKYFGIRIPITECSVREFYSYLKDIKK